jgi:ABC-type branched-subunit amino acid transport system ATPase component
MPDRPGAGEDRQHFIFRTARITRAPSHERVRAGIGYVPQGREIFPRLTVLENLQMGLATRPGGTPIPSAFSRCSRC